MNIFKKPTNRSAKTVARYFLHYAETNGNHNGITYEEMRELLNIAQATSKKWNHTTIFHPKTTWVVYPERIDCKFNPDDFFSSKELDVLEAVAKANIEHNAPHKAKAFSETALYKVQKELIRRSKACR